MIEKNPFCLRKWTQMIALSFLCLGVLGCNNAQRRLDSSDNVRELCLALVLYQEEKNEYPDTLDQLEPYIGKVSKYSHGYPIGNGKDFATLIKNPYTGDDPGYEYVKPPEKIESIRKTIVFYQLRNGKRDETLVVGWLDGSVRNIKDIDN